METARLFVGLPLPGDCQDALVRLERELNPLAPVPCAWTRPGEWHLTLKFLGETPLERLPALRRALSGVAWRTFAFRAGGAGCFPPLGMPRVLWAGVEQGGPSCAALAMAVEKALEPLGYARGERNFSAHLTVARARGRAPLRAWEPLLGALARARWPACGMERMVLWRSYAAGGDGGGGRPPGLRHVSLWEGGAPG